MKIGFIGPGKMAGAIIKGLLKSEFTTSEYILATQAEIDGIEEKKQALGIDIILDNKTLAQKSDINFSESIILLYSSSKKGIPS